MREYRELQGEPSIYTRQFSLPIHIGSLEFRGFTHSEKPISYSHHISMSEQEKETVWREFKTPHGAKVILTQSGQELVKNYNLLHALARYEDERDMPPSTPQYRQPFLPSLALRYKGGLYKIDALPVLAKEIEDSEYPAKERLLIMEYYRLVCDRYLRDWDWIKIPKHYGATEYSSRVNLTGRPLLYNVTLFMEQIEDAPSVQAYIDSSDRNSASVSHLRRVVREAKHILRSAAQKHASGSLRRLIADPDTNNTNILIDFQRQTKTRPYT